MKDAVHRANVGKAYRASAHRGTAPERVLSGRLGLTIELRDVGDAHRDEQACAPAFNYARFLHWTTNVEVVAGAFEAAAAHAAARSPVGTYNMWIDDPSLKGEMCGANRVGTNEEVRRYTRAGHWRHPRGLGSTGIVRRFLVASFLALALQWGTIGGGIIVVVCTGVFECKNGC